MPRYWNLNWYQPGIRNRILLGQKSSLKATVQAGGFKSNATLESAGIIYELVELLFVFWWWSTCIKIQFLRFSLWQLFIDNRRHAHPLNFILNYKLKYFIRKTKRWQSLMVEYESLVLSRNSNCLTYWTTLSEAFNGCLHNILLG